MAKTARNVLVRLILIHYVSSQKGFPSGIHEPLKLPHTTLINRATAGRCDIPGRDSLKYPRRADPISLEIGFSLANLQPASGIVDSGIVDLPKNTQPNSARSGIQLVIRVFCKVWSRIGGRKGFWESRLAYNIHTKSELGLLDPSSCLLQYHRAYLMLFYKAVKKKKVNEISFRLMASQGFTLVGEHIISNMLLT